MTPAWSPNGRWIAYTSDQDFEEVQFHIWIIPSTGGQPVRLTTSPTDTDSEEDPAWSPDGTRLAYESWRSGSADIWIITDVTVATRESTWSEIKKAYR